MTWATKVPASLAGSFLESEATYPLLSGLTDGLTGGEHWSRASRRVGPLYQSMLVDLSIMLCPWNPEIGTKLILSGLYPTFLRYPPTSLTISSCLFLEYFGSVASILLRATIICFTPRVKDRRACSLVCPSLEIPASNPPLVESIMRTEQSAWEVPVIMFLMKSLCPGASITVQWYFGVSNFQRAISMVIPLSLSAFSLSRTQAYLKDLLFISAASFSNFSITRLSIPPSL